MSLAHDKLFSGKVVALATGFIDSYSSMVRVRQQVGGVGGQGPVFLCAVLLGDCHAPSL